MRLARIDQDEQAGIISLTSVVNNRILKIRRSYGSAAGEIGSIRPEQRHRIGAVLQQAIAEGDINARHSCIANREVAIAVRCKAVKVKGSVREIVVAVEENYD